MKKITSVLFTLLLAVWIVHSWEPIHGTQSWTKKVYTTKKEPRGFLDYGDPFPVWVVKLDNGETLYLPMECTIIKKVEYDK